MIKLEIKNYSTTLMENLPKYHLYHQAKIINMSILLAKIYYHPKIEQAKFTYSLSRKAFEKQIKMIEDQREKQIKAIHNQVRVKTILKYASDDEGDSPWISKQKEIFNELADKRLNEINELDTKDNLDDLIYGYKGNTPIEEFNKYDNALDLIDKIKMGK